MPCFQKINEVRFDKNNVKIKKQENQSTLSNVQQEIFSLLGTILVAGWVVAGRVVAGRVLTK